MANRSKQDAELRQGIAGTQHQTNARLCSIVHARPGEHTNHLALDTSCTMQASTIALYTTTFQPGSLIKLSSSLYRLCFLMELVQESSFHAMFFWRSLDAIKGGHLNQAGGRLVWRRTA